MFNLKLIEMKKSLLFCCIFITSLTVFSQKPYSSAIGNRIEANEGDNNLFFGVSYKHYAGEMKSFEFIALTNVYQNQITGIELYGLFLYNIKLPDVPSNFRLVLGGGGSAGSWQWDNYVVGLTSKFGAEYTFNFMPINVELDWKPVLNIVTEKDKHFWPIKFGATIRYTLKGIKGSSKSSKKR